MTVIDIQDVTELEHQGWTALTRGDGGRFYGELMTSDAVMVLVNGAVLDREAVVASLDGAPAWDTFELRDLRLVPVGGDGAALVYEASATRRGEPEPFRALMTSVYVRRGETLALALYQQTAIPA